MRRDPVLEVSNLTALSLAHLRLAAAHRSRLGLLVNVVSLGYPGYVIHEGDTSTAFSWLMVCVCVAIPLHAARRAMAAAVGFSNNRIPSQTDMLGSSRAP